MIDMHSHILPAIDDGAKDVQQSVQMLCEAKSQGADVCVATSHCKLHKENSIADFLSNRTNAYDNLMQAVQGADVPKIILGAEVYLDNDISKLPMVEKLCIEGTNYMLVEFSFFSKSPSVYSEWLYNLTIKGIKPIIAHIDRYRTRDEMIQCFSDIDVVYQVNNATAFSIKGRRFLKKMQSHTVVMGSDMHNTDSRPCDIKKAYDIVAKKMPARVQDLFDANARKILNL